MTRNVTPKTTAMMTTHRRTSSVAILLILCILTSCVTMGSQRLVLRQNLFTSANYTSVKQIVVEEAANNGFSQLTSEVRPSEFNGWKGQLYFALVTPNGTDQLFVEFLRQGEGVSVHMHGAGTRANPDSASKAIAARLRQL